MCAPNVVNLSVFVDIRSCTMMPRYGMDMAGTRNGYRRDMDFTQKMKHQIQDDTIVCLI